ncbi:MAG TPA: bifunctional diaminohydroxyphosphoribosylaminopyrimidine deaminase/5-amino-6-(5-phosphoribosylamino)uracil reductase RibD, partial [Verrucomicrobiae bacterium]|nr:bifunctional diaminohydroxyphosphoribosylaminopyrimidine deaminase/5-amino-6-(5-phosphoribosylamino)uracil reductase RibD [Verrucomicrobiae bacterium]
MHEKYMRMALELAERARGRTSPNPMVGAVLVKDGQIIGQGYHKKAGTPHAEVHALNEAGGNARGATLYVTLEPCSHYGRTPPCSEAVIRAGITEVHVAVQDPNPLVAGRGIKLMADAGIKVNVGLLDEEACELNEVFIKYITKKTPFVLLKTAMTLDGKIA